MLVSLAWRNIWRQPVRSVLSLIGLAFSSLLLVFMLSFQFGVYDTIKIGALGLFDGFGQFQPEGYDDDPDISKQLPGSQALLAADQIKGVSATAPRASSFAILANGDTSFGAAVIGVDPAREPAVSTLYSTISEGRYLEPEDSAAIVMGAGLVRNLGLALGDNVTMLGTGNDGAVAADVLELVGIFSTGVNAVDRQITQMPLARFQETYNMGENVNVIALRGPDFNGVIRAAPDLQGLAEAEGAVYLRWDDLQPEVRQMITLDLSTAMLMYGIMIVVVVFILLNTLYMSVLERTREFGGLMAIGMRPAQIGAMVWLELVFLSLLGAGIGIALGAGITIWVENVGISFPGMEDVLGQWGISGRVYPDLSFFSASIGPGIIVGSIIILGLIPYRRILGLEPVSAMGAA
ncbi:MAG: ABC transporter permease [Rhodobacteraceae bacterium]|nr:ABC transporter permease [Paracoccaceae bacterium]